MHGNGNIAVPVSSPGLNGVLNAECTAGKENIIVHFESVGKWGWCEDCHLCQECHGASALEEAGDCEDVWQQRHRCHISTIYNGDGREWLACQMIMFYFVLCLNLE